MDISLCRGWMGGGVPFGSRNHDRESRQTQHEKQHDPGKPYGRGYIVNHIIRVYYLVNLLTNYQLFAKYRFIEPRFNDKR